MRQLILALTVLALAGGPALAEPATNAPTPSATESGAPAVSNAREEKVCRTEPIANSRLRKRKICTSRLRAERNRTEQRENARRQLESGGVQANQRGG